MSLYPKKHSVITMPVNEAYPATAGIRCVNCGKLSLGWVGTKPRALGGACKPKEKS